MSLNPVPIRTDYVPAWRYLFQYLRRYGIIRTLRMTVIFARLRIFNPFEEVEVEEVEVLIYKDDVN